MTRFILLLAVSFCSSGLYAQIVSPNSKTRIYLVRHGEKESGKDPVLTTAGKQRAGELMLTMQHKQIRRIYVTPTQRSEMMADSMRIQLGIDTVHYLADTTGEGLLNSIRAHGDMRKKILVIGHSNTIPKLISKLGVENYPQQWIADKEHDNLFLVRYKRHIARVTITKYGAASLPSAAMH